MAVRDRNLFAWQAYVITMAFVSVGLLLGMFFLWRSYSDLSKRLTDQTTQMDNYRQQFTTSEARVSRLLAMVGQGEYADTQDMSADEVLGPVEQQFTQAMSHFATNVAASERNLMSLHTYLLDTIRARNDDIAAARERESKLTQDMTATLQRESKAREDAVIAQKKAESDLETARQKYASALVTANADKDAALKKFDDYRAYFEKELATVTTENRRLLADNQKQAETISQQMEELIAFRNLDFAAPQGEIVRATDGGTTVWINLGREDGLREGVPFSVIDESAVNISEASPKAKLVIVSVIPDAPHLSRAKVTDYDYSHPIVTGDKVYSPAWRPGRAVGFALVGMMDMDGDSRDDIEQVREQIRLSGGVIHAEMDTKGSQTDSPGLNPNTSFLVLGTDLNISANSSPQLNAQQKARAEKYAAFIAEAKKMGIIQISLDKLMGYLKTEGSDRTIPLGDRIRADDFPIRSEGRTPESRGSVSELFQQRKP
jgi:hypothetical protein